MIPRIQDILNTLDEIAPHTLAETWDNVGLLLGDRTAEVNSILVGLDPTNRLIDEAISKKIDTVITHHPVIFKPLSSIETNNPGGRLLQKALASQINIIACHTNLDSAVDGLNDVLASALELSDFVPLQPSQNDSEAGLGRIGSYPEPLTTDEFLSKLFSLLELDSFAMAGKLPEKIARVALCGGSGSDFASIAYHKGADVYLSAEIKHATAVWANETGFAVIDGTHYSTEKPATAFLCKKLKEKFTENKWNVSVNNTETEVHPFVSVSHNQ